VVDRRRQQAEQLLELRGLRGKSGTKLRMMMERVDTEVADFESCTAKLAALRAVQMRILRTLLAPLSSDHLRAEIAAMQSAMGSRPFNLGGKAAFEKLMQRLHASLDRAGGQAEEMRLMLEASFRELNTEFGFAFALGPVPQLGPFKDELSLIDQNYSVTWASGQVWRMAAPGFAEQFRRLLTSKLRVVFENASGELEMWSKSAQSQVEMQLRERRRGFTRRRDALQRVQGATGELESRIAEVQSQDENLTRAGNASMAATACPGRTRATPTACGCRRSCCSRRRWPPCIDYYARFLERFPDVQTLAAAPLDEVLALWSGLGYYSRARNLHRCAQAVVAEHGGVFPRTAQRWSTLPGIGRSTAAAIAAFCFGERVAILDGNVKRVLTRALGFDGDLAGAAAQQRLWAEAEALLPRRDVDVYTQGLMDLGATVCTTRRPACPKCPLQDRCVAHALGQPERYPVKTRKLKRSRRANALLWLVHGARVWLVQRPATGVWAGLWSLPEYPDAAALEAATAGWPGQGRWLPGFEHTLTHLDWHLQPLCWQWPARRRCDQAPGRWCLVHGVRGLGARAAGACAPLAASGAGA
jgi:A/G-specific adenine glycosylase